MGWRCWRVPGAVLHDMRAEVRSGDGLAWGSLGGSDAHVGAHRQGSPPRLTDQHISSQAVDWAELIDTQFDEIHYIDVGSIKTHPRNSLAPPRVGWGRDLRGQTRAVDTRPFLPSPAMERQAARNSR